MLKKFRLAALMVLLVPSSVIFSMLHSSKIMHKQFHSKMYKRDFANQQFKLATSDKVTIVIYSLGLFGVGSMFIADLKQESHRKQYEELCRENYIFPDKYLRK